MAHIFKKFSLLNWYRIDVVKKDSNLYLNTKHVTSANSLKCSNNASSFRHFKKPTIYGLFLGLYLRSFQTIFRIKTVDFSGIRTWIVAVEGDHTDDLTTSTAQP